MMLRLFFLLLFSLGGALPLAAEGLSVDVAPRQLGIGGLFGGAELSVFGQRPITGALIAVLEGPMASYALHKKEKNGPFWINGPSKGFAALPVFYQILSAKPVNTLLAPETRDARRIGYDSLFPQEDRNNKYAEAFVRLKQKTGHYLQREDVPALDGNTLYRADFSIPNTVPTGTYTLRLFLVQEGAIVASAEKAYPIRETGMMQALTELIRGNGLAFALLTVVGAMGIGLLGAALMPRR